MGKYTWKSKQTTSDVPIGVGKGLVRLLPAWPPVLLFLLLFGIYSANLDFTIIGDLKPSVYQSLQILKRGEWTFTPDSHPFLFKWRSGNKDKKDYFRINHWDPELRKQYAAGTIKPMRCDYFIVESTTPGRYVNFFGVGAAVMALPVYAVAQLFVPDLDEHPWLLWFLSKEMAAALVAGSAALLYLAAITLTSRRNALIIAFAYGLGTCVWSTCSQGLWQQTPNVFFLALGTCLFFRIDKVKWQAAPCGIAYAMAVWCRPTSAIVALCVGAYLVLHDRRAFMAYALAGLPFAVALAFYNQHYLGSPVAFGQEVGGRIIAVAKTGSPVVWQTPLFKGLLGLIASPSRGLFVFSPYLLLAIPGMVQIWTTPRHAVLRPLLVAVLIVLCIEAKHFDWWGGWSYGYRHVLDMTVLLSLMFIPVIDSLCRRMLLRGLLALTLLWSVAVQVIGVTAYDLSGWNNRNGISVYKKDQPDPVIVLEKSEADAMRRDKDFIRTQWVKLNVDKKEYRYRLWELKDSQLVYYATHFRASRELRYRVFQSWLNQEAEIVPKMLEPTSGKSEDGESES